MKSLFLLLVLLTGCRLNQTIDLDAQKRKNDTIIIAKVVQWQRENMKTAYKKGVITGQLTSTKLLNEGLTTKEVNEYIDKSYSEDSLLLDLLIVN